MDASNLKCLSFMRHSIATHNEAAAAYADAMDSVYLSEAYADASLSSRGHALVQSARQSKLGLSPAPSIVLCSPLTRAIQTAIGMFGGTGIRILAVPEAREAHGRFPCDRHRDKSELELMFGDRVDFSLCNAKDTVWSPYHREQMTHLDNRVARFVEGVLRQREAAHVFVVSHGVFIESALRQLAHPFLGHSSENRVHNCDVNSFVFSVPPPAPSSSSPSTFDTPSAAGGAHRHTNVQSGSRIAAPSATMTPNASGSGGSGGGMSPMRPRVEAYLTGQDLDNACTAGMPLVAVAHINRVVRRFSGDGDGGSGVSLTEEQFSTLLACCQLGPQETRWLYRALRREGGGGGGGGGRVASGDFLLALMAFYPGEGGGGGGRGGGEAPAGSRGGMMVDLRRQYQREMCGTPLANYELLGETFKGILSTVLATPWQ